MITETTERLNIRIHDLISPEKCFDFLRKERWSKGIRCPKCTSNSVKKNGHKDSDPLCQKYKCTNCGRRFNDFSGTVLAKKHHPINVWINVINLKNGFIV